MVPSASAAPDDVIAAGQVWEDNDGDGAHDEDGSDGFLEQGVGNVTVTVTDALGNSATTRTNRVDAAGGWSMTEGEFTDQTGEVPNVADGATVAELRITFSDIPEGYASWLAGDLADNGTSVQFVAAGDQSVDYAVLPPEDHRPQSPDVITAIHSAGDPLAEGTTGQPALVVTDWATAQDTGKRDIATVGDVGTVWGTAYEQASNTFLASAVYRRNAGLAEHRWDGSTDRALGAIYRIPDAIDPATGDVAAGIGPVGGVEAWFSLTDLGIDVGTVASNADRALAAGVDPTADPDGFANAAKVGLGGIDTWTDGVTTYLFVMNLADGNLYRIDISPTNPVSPDFDPAFVPAAGDVEQIALGLGDAQSGWAVEVQGDEVYVGWADTGSAPGSCATVAPGESTDSWPQCASAEPLRGYVGKVPVGGGAVAQVMDVDLGYPRGNPMSYWDGTQQGNVERHPQIRHWNSWTDVWTWDSADANADSWPDGSVGFSKTAAGDPDGAQAYPQAIMSSITFNTAGYMTVGMIDRTELQGGNRQWAADTGQDGGTSSEIVFETIAQGDIMLAGRNADGTYTPETGAAAEGTGLDGETTQWANGKAPILASGPGGNEFHGDDQGLDGTVIGVTHEEIALGAVLDVAGATDVASTSFDPLATLRVQGLIWFNDGDGAATRGVEFTEDEGNTGRPTVSFQKGGGLGDLDALIPPAPVEIGNRVWFDGNGDGLQDAGEPGIPGVTVELVDAADAVVGTQVTAADGTYYFSSDATDTAHFTELVHGAEYTARFVTPADGDLAVDYLGAAITVPWSDVLFTTMQATTGDNPHAETDNADGVNPRPEPVPDVPEAAEDADRTDSNPDPATGEYTFTLGGYGQNDHSIDAGVVILGSIGDCVWSDLNGDGIQDEGEPGVEGVVVNLYDVDGNLVDTTTTDAECKYLFEGLPLGDYTVEFIAPDGSVLSPQSAGEDPAVDSDADPATGMTPVVSLTPGSPVDLDVDAGIVPTDAVLGSIGDCVWFDENTNGIQDDGEAGVEGVTVILFGADGDEVSRTTTDADCAYLFADLPLGDYSVGFTDLPDGMVFTELGAGDDPAVDSDADPVTGQTGSYTLTEEVPDRLDVDAGIYEPTEPLGSIGDCVWSDLNGDGIQDDGEPGVEGVTVVLYDAEGAEVATTTTDAECAYLFTGLPLGDYSVGFENLPEGATFTTPGAGDNPAVDSDANPETGMTGTVSLTEDFLDRLDIDAGVVSPDAVLGSIGDCVWFDENTNGLQDEGEPGVEDVTVVLYDAEGAEVATTTTDADCKYLFTDLPLGDYSVGFTDLPEGATFTLPGAGDDPALDSDADMETGTTDTVSLTEEVPDRLDVDAGVVSPDAVLGSIGDCVWFDKNADGIQDDGEAGVKGVTVILFGADGDEVARTTTGADCKYLFADLPLGDYSVGFTDLPEDKTFTVPGAGDDPALDSDADQLTGRTGTYSLTEETPDRRDVDAGVVSSDEVLGSIGDCVWFDENEDGLQNDGESGVEGVTVTLYDAEGNVVATTTTDAECAYLFTGLPPGDYTVTFGDVPEGMCFVAPGAGDKPARDSDADRKTGETGTVAVTEGNLDRSDIDAGLRDCADETPGEDPGEMANTGANVALIALLSVLLVAVGTILVVWRNRRRNVV
ncbi:SdrD B-like domain-containing protein [Promicromonospora sp. NPDC023805]|uniref:SdrD B-like domain-containing protein n=1 Tax=Promicromonospora sp. NPDC023805 TaxID=3154696 RepID=UPI0033D36605